MDNNGQSNGPSIASHILLWIFMAGVGVWLVYSATHTKNKTDTFTGNAKQTNNYHVTRNYALFALDLALTPFSIHGCTRQDAPEQQENAVVNNIETNVVDNSDKP